MRWNRPLAMGRKRNQGKARRAAKEAKAREEATESENNNQVITDGPAQSLSAQSDIACG